LTPASVEMDARGPGIVTLPRRCCGTCVRSAQTWPKARPETLVGGSMVAGETCVVSLDPDVETFADWDGT